MAVRQPMLAECSTVFASSRDVAHKIADPRCGNSANRRNIRGTSTRLTTALVMTLSECSEVRHKTLRKPRQSTGAGDHASTFRGSF